MMIVDSAVSVEADLHEAVKVTAHELKLKLGGEPNFVLVYYTDNYSSGELAQLMAQYFPKAKVHGCSTCRAVMSNDGFHSNEGKAFGVWGVRDEFGDYGTALIKMNGQPRQAGNLAVRQALENAGRLGEIPEMVWISVTPGFEEEVLLGIQEVIGVDVPIAGGSAADNEIAGRWSVLSNEYALSDGVVLSVMFSSSTISYAFRSGYEATQFRGIVTKAAGRVLVEVDNKSAAEVYNRWTEGMITHALDEAESVSILADTALFPIGRKVTSISDVDYYKLSHPEQVIGGKAMSLFSNIDVGEEIVLMQGSKRSLISRAGRTVRSALMLEDMDPKKISGALINYCAGCMLTVEDSMSEVVFSIDAALEGKPFLGGFTFGEQGCFINSVNSHGNLMISTVVFDG